MKSVLILLVVAFLTLHSTAQAQYDGEGEGDCGSGGESQENLTYQDAGRKAPFDTIYVPDRGLAEDAEPNADQRFRH
jgi:hypothetical protein